MTKMMFMTSLFVMNQPRKKRRIETSQTEKAQPWPEYFHSVCTLIHSCRSHVEFKVSKVI